MINWNLLKNPANWLVVGSMVLIGATMYSLVTTHISAKADNKE